MEIVIKDRRRKYILKTIEVKLYLKKGNKITNGSSKTVFNDKSNRKPNKIAYRYVIKGTVFEKFSPMKMSRIIKLRASRNPSKKTNNLNELLSI